MVLPQSAADAGGAQAWASASLGALARLFERSEQGVLVLMHGAVPTRLGEVVRFFSPAPPWSDEGEVLRVCLQAAELHDVPEGSRVLLRVRAEDVAYLNVIRPLFTERRLRVILWTDHEALGPLLSTAVDLVDWVGRTVEVPPRRWPVFAEEGVRAALDAGVPFAWDGEREEIEALLGDVGWTGGRVDLGVEMSFQEMVRQLNEHPGLPVGMGMGRKEDVWRVRMALARTGRAETWVALEPVAPLMGLWGLHARQADWSDAVARLAEAGWEHAGLMAAWVDLEPEQIEAAIARVGRPPRDPSVWSAARIAVGAAPVPVLRLRVGDEDVREELQAIRDGMTPWSDDTSRASDRERERLVQLARYLRNVCDEVPPAELIDVAISGGLIDVAAELGKMRFERGIDDEAHRVVAWLSQFGENEEALCVADTWAERAQAAGDRRSLATAWTSLADLQVSLGCGDQARRHFEDALLIREKLVEQDPGRTDLEWELSVSLSKLAELQMSLGEEDQARRYYEDALVFRRSLVDRDPTSAFQWGLLLSCESLADLHVSLGTRDQAQRYYEEALAIARVLPNPKNKLYEYHGKLGDLYVALGNEDQALPHYEDALAIARKRSNGSGTFDANAHRDVADFYEKLGDLYLALGNEQRAQECHEASLRERALIVLWSRGTVDPLHQLAVSYDKLGELYASMGNAEHAYQCYQAAVAIRRALVEREPAREDFQRALSSSLNKRGDLDTALGILDRDQPMATRERPVDQWRASAILHGEAAASYERMAATNPDKADDWLSRALFAHRARVRVSPQDVISQKDLALALSQLGRLPGQDPDQAAKHLREASEILDALRAQDALEAEYHELADRLARERTE